MASNVYAVKVLFLYFFLGADVAINCLVGAVVNDVLNIILAIVQGVLLLVDLFLIFLLMWDTILFGYGLLGLLCAQLRPIFIVLPLYLAMSVALRINQLTSGASSPTFLALYYTHSCVSIIYYAVALHTTFSLADSKLYMITDEWIK